MSRNVVSLCLRAVLLSLVSFLTVFVGILVMYLLNNRVATAIILLLIWVVPLLIFPLFFKKTCVECKYDHVLMMFVSIASTIVLVVCAPRFEQVFDWVFSLYDEHDSVELLYPFYAIHCLIVETAWMFICLGKARRQNSATQGKGEPSPRVIKIDEEIFFESVYTKDPFIGRDEQMV